MKTKTLITLCTIIGAVLTTQLPAIAQQASSSVDTNTETEQWVSLGSYDTSTIEYDLQSLQWLDSEHISVSIKTTPRTPIIKKLLQDNNIGLHPISFYCGYEYYGYNIRQVVIDLKHYRSMTINS